MQRIRPVRLSKSCRIKKAIAGSETGSKLAVSVYANPTPISESGTKLAVSVQASNPNPMTEINITTPSVATASTAANETNGQTRDSRLLSQVRHEEIVLTVKDAAVASTSENNNVTLVPIIPTPINAVTDSADNTYCVYVLHCADGNRYVGRVDSEKTMGRRFQEHKEADRLRGSASGTLRSLSKHAFPTRIRFTRMPRFWNL